MEFSNILDAKDEDLKTVLKEIEIEETYMENCLTQGAVSSEYTATVEEYFKLAEPTKKIVFDDIKETPNKSKALLSIILMIVSLNDLSDLTDYPNVRYLTYAILLIACTSGCLKSDKKFEIVEYKINDEKEDFKTKKDDIKGTLKMLPVAKNFCALSVINYIRFNHHFPHEKVNLIKKAFIGIPDNEINNFLEVDKENLKLFYQYPFQASKLLNEWAYFYTNINQTVKMTEEDKSDIQMLHYGIIRNYTSPDQIITIRNEPTTNCFLILDLVYIFLTYLDSHEILGLLPDTKTFEVLINIRSTLKKHPFSYHPGRNYFQIKYKKQNFNDLVTQYQENINKIGNLIYNFCIEEGGSLGEAKSILKYEHHSLGEYKNIFEIYRVIKENQSIISEEQKKKIQNLVAPKIKVPESAEELQASNEKIRQKIFIKSENIINFKEN